MKKLCLIIIFLLVTITARENTLETHYNRVDKTNFQLAFERISKLEGYYSNNILDKGGETYRGISRVYNPNWYGWYIIDDYKKNHQVKWNIQIPEADHYVLDYYLTIWVREGFENIIDSKLAAYLFEFRIHGNHAVRIMRRLLLDKVGSLPITTNIDSTFISYSNLVYPLSFINKLKEERKKFYNNIVKKDSSQLIFLNGWKKRLE